jgi:hypothetical protein
VGWVEGIGGQIVVLSGDLANILDMELSVRRRSQTRVDTLNFIDQQAPESQLVQKRRFDCHDCPNMGMVFEMFARGHLCKSFSILAVQYILEFCFEPRTAF